MDSRSRNVWLMVAALPGLAAPWIPFLEIGDSKEALRFAFVDFFDMPAMGYPQTSLERLKYIVDTLPVFAPFLVLLCQVRRQIGRGHIERGSGRIAVALALVWVAYYAAMSLWQLPYQLLRVWEDADLQASMGPLWSQGIRIIGLFGPIGIGALLLMFLVSQSTTADALDTTECACMVTFVITVLPELVSDAVSASAPVTDEYLLPGYGVLLWICMVYGATLAVRLVEWRPLLRSRSTAN